MSLSNASEKYNSEPNLSITETPLNQMVNRSKRKKLDMDSEEHSEIRSELLEVYKTSLSQHQEQMNALYPILKAIQESHSKIEATLAFVCQQNDDFKTQIVRLENELKKKEEHITLLEDKMEDLTRTSRGKYIEIKNIAMDSKEPKENLIKMVEDLSKNLEINVDQNEVSDIFKVKSNTDRKTIIVEFKSTMTKDLFIKKAKAFNKKNPSNKLSAKHLGLRKNPDEPIYISEHLTLKAARLYFLARDLKRSKKFKYCWTSFGRIYLRKDDDAQIIWIRNEDQIVKLRNIM